MTVGNEQLTSAVCTVTGLIQMGDDKIEMQRCGCLEKKLLNGTVVYEKLLSASRCGGTSIASAGGAPRRGAPPVL